MYRSRLEKDLDELHDNLIKLGGMIEQAIASSVNALVNQNSELAQKVIAGDKEINQLSEQIESEALKILLRQQPVASDLRVISTALKMVTDMERIGDQARDICSIVLHLCEEQYHTKLKITPQMGDIVKNMVGACIDAFVRQDIELARRVIAMDDEVDALFSTVKDMMIELIKKKPQYADYAIYLMMVAKYFEKIGDHAENIAEWVIYSQTGERKHD